MKLTVLVPSYNDLAEALLVRDLARQDSEWARRGEVLLFSRDQALSTAAPEGSGGPALALREVLRFLSGVLMDRYTWGKLGRALLFRPVPRGQIHRPQALAGYDYRRDRDAIAARLRIYNTSFLPSNLLAFVAPTVLLLCRANDVRAQDSRPSADSADSRR